MYADRIAEYDVLCNFERSTASKDETKANALLMSKAPKMLQQLIWVVEHSDYILHGENEHCDVLYQMLNSIEKIIKESTEI